MLDIIQRYQPIVRLIKKNPPPDKKIIEVGGGGDGIGYYLKKYQILDCDLVHAPTIPTNTRPIVIKNEKIPFVSKYIHTLVCVDTLEHLPSQRRKQKLIREMVRVTTKYLYLAIPTGEESLEAHQKLKKHLLRFYPRRTNTFLDEHLANGHPSVEEILKIIKQAAPQATIRMKKNGNIFLWLLFQKIYLALPCLYRLLKYRDFWRKILAPFWGISNLGLTIRTIYIVNLKPADEEY